MRTLTELGADRIFTLVGDHLNEVLAEAARAGLPVLDMRHESGVTHAADAWARLHRAPAVSLVTGGPGHTNSLTGVATAHLAGSPLVAISGSRPSTAGRRQAFQDIDQCGMARPVVKWAAEPPNAAQIPFYLARAFAESNSGRRGAVHLTIPVNLFLERCAEAPAAGPLAAPGLPAPDPRQIERVLGLLRAAERPVVIAGSGIWWSDAAAELREFVERTATPLYTITMARGTVPDDHPLVMGYADPALNHAVHRVYAEADFFLVIGKRIDYRLALGGTRLFPATARFAQIDIHPEELGLNRKLDAAVWSDARLALRALCDAAGPRPWPPRPWLERVRALRCEWEQTVAAKAADNSAPLHPAAFFAELRQALPRDVLYSWDGGDFAHWGRASLPATQAGAWLRLGPLGTIGSALPNSLALQLAHPGRPVVMITGDGALGFYIAEFDTAVRHKLPVVFIVGNDAGWGLERELQGFGNPGAPTVGCELRATRYDVVMQGFGGGGETIETIDQVRPAVDRAFSSGMPYCLNVRIRGTRSPFTDWQIAGKKHIAANKRE